MVSPFNPGKHHTYESVIGVIPHEYVHTVIYRMNPKTPLWLDEGIALYLTNGAPLGDINNYNIPSFDDIQTNNPIKFSNIGGYSLAHTYVEYLNDEYGFDKVIDFISGTLSYEETFGVTSEEIYNGWVQYLNSKY